jgi:cell division protease FtsH
MSDKLGAMTYGEKSENGQYLGLGGYHEKMYSEMTAEEIDQEVRLLIDAAYDRAKKLVTEHKDQIELMTEMLIEFETLDAEDVEKIVKGTWNIEDKRGKLKALLEKSKKVPPPVPKEALEGSTDRPTTPEAPPPPEPVQQISS